MENTGILGINGDGDYYISITPGEHILVFRGKYEELKDLVSRRVSFTTLESFPPYATDVELYVPSVEVKKFPSNKKELENILMELSYAISQGTYGGCSTHQHIASLFMKDQGYE